MPEPEHQAVHAEPGAAPSGGPADPSAGCAPGARGRHGRARSPQAAGDALAQGRLVRLAVLPGVAVVLTAGVVVTVLLGAGRGGEPPAGGALWGVLGSALLLVCAVLAGAVAYARAESRATVERCAAVRRGVTRGRSEVRALVREMERGQLPAPRAQAPQPEPSGDSLDLVAHEVALARREAEAAVVCAAELARTDIEPQARGPQRDGDPGGRGPEPAPKGLESVHERVEVFVNLARRLQSLVHREIELLDELEAEVEDPDLLKGLFHVDHLATRVRRHAENLAVLGGAVSRRQWTRPVTMTEVLRSAIAEVEQYPRVKLVPPIEGTLRGHAVADVIHLLAELIENATVFSAPQSQVLLRAQHVTAGLAVEVEDRGLGMTASEQSRMNSVLADPERIDVPELLQDGRIGLFVVSALAQRHGIVVQLQSNIYGGVQAVLVVPHGLLGDEPEETRAARDVTSTQQNAAVEAADAGREARHRRTEPGGGAQRPSTPGPLPAQRPAPAPQAPPQRAPQPASPAHHGGQRAAPMVTNGALPFPEEPAHGRAAGAESAAYGAGTVPSAYHPNSAAPAGGSAPGVHEAGGAAAAEAADAASTARPRLPRRRRQQHLAPELRDAPERAEREARAEAVAEEGHDPGLMAAFRRGTSLAEEPDEARGDAAEPAAAAQGPAYGGGFGTSPYTDGPSYGAGATSTEPPSAPRLTEPHEEIPASGGDSTAPGGDTPRPTR